MILEHEGEPEALDVFVFQLKFLRLHTCVPEGRFAVGREPRELAVVNGHMPKPAHLKQEDVQDVCPQLLTGEGKDEYWIALDAGGIGLDLHVLPCRQYC